MSPLFPHIHVNNNDTNTANESSEIDYVDGATGNVFLEPRDSIDSDDDNSFKTAEQSRVRFSAELVTDVWERPKTPYSQRTVLFYQADEIRTFRQEYRNLIRQKLAAHRRAQLEKQQQVSTLRYFVNKASQIASQVTSHGIELSKTLSEPSETDSVFVDTLYLF